MLAFVDELAPRYAPPGADPAAMREGFATQIPKRVAIEFAEVGRVSLGPPQARRHVLARR